MKLRGLQRVNIRFYFYQELQPGLLSPPSQSEAEGPPDPLRAQEVVSQAAGAGCPQNIPGGEEGEERLQKVNLE